MLRYSVREKLGDHKSNVLAYERISMARLNDEERKFLRMNIGTCKHNS